MLGISRIGAAAVIAAAAVSIVGTIGTAHADPPAGVSPKATDIVGVGSDTTQFVMDAYSIGFNNQPVKPVRKLYSWDAVTPGTNPPTANDSVTLKQGCAPIIRSTINGSSAGIAALKADTAGCIDFARSSRAKATDGTENNLAFFAFARDGVTWTAIPSTHTPANLTTAQLASIYTCQVTNWHQISTTLPSNVIQPFLPQVGSGTRKFFLGALSLTDASVGACVNQTQEENNGSFLAGNANRLAPYSIARWISQTPVAQGGTGKEANIRGGGTLRKINGHAPTVTNATTHKIRLNTLFDAAFLRQVYNVVKKRADGSVDPAYLALFAPFNTATGTGGYLCQKQGSVVVNYGFGILGSACGAIS